MRFSRSASVVLVTGLFLWSIAGSDDQSGSEKVKIGGYGYWEFGQIVRGAGGAMDHQWMSHTLLGIRVEKQALPYLKLIVSPEFKLYYPFPERPNNPSSVRPVAASFINEMHGIFSFGNLDKPLLTCDAGVFRYKYNPQARDLGEYLFRTGTLPTFIVTDFDYPEARLLGLKLSTSAVENLKADLLLTSEWQYYPLYDFSLSGIASYNLLGAVDVGAGIELARILSVKPERTTIDTSGFIKNWEQARYIKKNGDTGFYSFSAPKFMGRITIDPKPFFPALHLMGAEDLKVYGEVALIGLKYDAKDTSTQYAFYNDIVRRLPAMFGINIPAFKALDVLSAEFEYFSIGYPNDYRKLYELVPMPFLNDPANYNPNNFNDLNWRWAFYGKRTFKKSFSLCGQMAYDHFRTTYTDGSTNTEEILTKKGDWVWNWTGRKRPWDNGDWYWIVKLSYLL